MWLSLSLRQQPVADLTVADLTISQDHWGGWLISADFIHDFNHDLCEFYPACTT